VPGHVDHEAQLVDRGVDYADIATTAIYADAMGAEEREIAARMWECPAYRIYRRAGP